MASYTREELEAMFETASQLMEIVQTYAESRHQIDRDFPSYFSIEEDGFDEDGIDISHEVHVGCGDYETRSHRITIDDLLDTDFESVKAEMEEAKRREEERRKAEAERRRKAQEAHERRQLQALLAKYPDEKEA